jgi:hypothetical protein
MWDLGSASVMGNHPIGFGACHIPINTKHKTGVSHVFNYYCSVLTCVRVHKTQDTSFVVFQQFLIHNYGSYNVINCGITSLHIV